MSFWRLQNRQKLNLSSGLEFLFLIWLIDFIFSKWGIPWLSRLREIQGSYYGYYAVSLSAYIFGIIVLTWFLMKVYKLDFGVIGFKKWDKRRMLMALPLGILCLFIADPYTSYIAIAKGSLSDFASNPLPYLILGLVIGPFFEEIFYRGCIQQIIARRLKSKFKAVFLATLLFSMSHTEFKSSLNSENKKTHFIEINILPGGFVYGGLYYFSQGNILAPMLLHSLRNTVAILAKTKDKTKPQAKL